MSFPPYALQVHSVDQGVKGHQRICYGFGGQVDRVTCSQRVIAACEAVNAFIDVRFLI